MKKIIRILLPTLWIVTLIIGCSIGFRRGRTTTPAPLGVKVDTLYVPDTNAIYGPKKSQEPRVITKEIPVPVYIADSAAIDSLLGECARLERRGDSLQLILLREQRHYSDLTYDAWVSGVDPQLDSLKIYHNDMIVTNQVPVMQTKKTRWGIGVQAGYGVGREGLSPYVGIGVSYNIVTW